MECNTKTSVQWEWENLISFGASTKEIPRKLRPLDWEIDGFDSISFCSSGFAGIGGNSGGNCSKSTSFSSSSADIRTYNFKSEASERRPEDICSNEEFAKGISGTSPSVEASINLGEPILGLKLGKRTYFGDICAGNSLKSSTLPVSLTSSASPVKRPKSASPTSQISRCQVEGCNLDLSSAKDYHRKHRVCEIHSKCPIVVINGLERRFCQQCSRFHGLCEFDEKKRSCRRRLSDHNARRRKPQPEPMQLNHGRSYAGKQQTDLVWNKFALFQPKNEDKCLWGSGLPNSKAINPKGFILKDDKFDDRMHFNSNKLPRSTTRAMDHGGFGFLTPKNKTATTEFLSKETIEEDTISSQMGESQDLDGALSLLSYATSWGSLEPRCPALGQTHPHPVAHRLNSSLNHWQPTHQELEPHRDTDSQLQFFREQSNDNYFCSNPFS